MLVPPISVREFLQLLHKCKPSGQWQGPIAVANSGGPDSMCLLFLLSQAVKQYGSNAGLPTDVYSLHIDHGLQAANEDMKRKVSALAESLQVQDIQQPIPWGLPPFPRKPLPGSPFEEVARNARTEMLHRAILRAKCRDIAFGHHADDQVETVLMRIMRGSGQHGMAGMRRARLWGMGTPHKGGLGFLGITGMNRWIVRPFLDIPKDRILATCEANKIDYVVDPSNFQPDITIRNNIRAQLASRTDVTKHESVNHVGSRSHGAPGPHVEYTSFSGPEQTFSPVDHAIHKLQNLAGTDDLYEAVRRTNEAQCRIDSTVSWYLSARASFSESPIASTFIFNQPLARRVEDPMTRVALVRRILQHVSPFPWGSTAAEAHGSKASLERIAHTLWDTSIHPAERKPFSAGGKVMWTPTTLHTLGTSYLNANPTYDKHMNRWKYDLSNRRAPRVVWIAHRAPPSAHENHEIVSTISSERLRHKDESTIVMELWDNRFSIGFKMPLLRPSLPIPPGRDYSIIIEPHGRWFLPRITALYEGKKIDIGEFMDDSSEGSNPHEGTWFRTAFPGVSCHLIRPLFPELRQH